MSNILQDIDCSQTLLFIISTTQYIMFPLYQLSCYSIILLWTVVGATMFIFGVWYNKRITYLQVYLL